jgi:ABC-type multidrug transport system ATPase subunit
MIFSQYCQKMRLALFFDNGSFILEPENTYVVGRGSNSDIVVKNNSVSRSHCRIHFDSISKWVIEDLGSTHGTQIEGKAVSSTPILKNTHGRLGGVNGVDFRIQIIQAESSSVAQSIKTVFETKSINQGPRIPLQNRLRIGRDPRNDWTIDDLTVSNFHAEVNMVSAGNYEITDLNSINGIYVNGSRAKRRKLNSGDIISIAGVKRRFTLDGLELLEAQPGARVKLDNVSYVTRDGAFLLKGISLNLGPATLTAIVGPSGAGKSTLMDVITQKKSCTFGECDVSDSAMIDGQPAKIGFVPQADILHTKLTVRQALLFGADLRFPSSASKKEKEDRVNEVLKLVELDQRANLRIDRLSGGQRKRCSIALELLSKPDLLILDEPTSGLDPGLDLHFMELMRTLTNNGQTVIVVTHAIDNVDICDNVVLLRSGGTLAYAGPPTTVFSVLKENSWARIFRELSLPDKVDLAALQSKSSKTKSKEFIALSQQDIFRQTWTLIRRYLSVIMADKFYVALLFVLPLVLGLIGFAAGTDSGFEMAVGKSGQGVPNPQAQMLALILILGCVFVSLSTSIQEIVKDKEIRLRESRIGIRTSSYLASKAIVLGIISSLQILLFYNFTIAGRSAGADPLILQSSKIELQVICLFLGMASMLLGLVMSTLITSQEQGMPTLVLLTMIQVIISGALPIRLDWLINSTGLINPAYWGMNALGASTDLNMVTGLFGEKSHVRWNHLPENYYLPSIILLIFSLIFLFVAFFSLSRKEKN